LLCLRVLGRVLLLLVVCDPTRHCGSRADHCCGPQQGPSSS
jgi:hypothetical protein